MPIVLLESGVVAPRPPGLGARKSHKSTIGIANFKRSIKFDSQVIQALEVERVDAPGMPRVWFF